jgi:hypothetical protein
LGEAKERRSSKETFECCLHCHPATSRHPFSGFGARKIDQRAFITHRGAGRSKPTAPAAASRGPRQTARLPGTLHTALTHGPPRCPHPSLAASRDVRDACLLSAGRRGRALHAGGTTAMQGQAGGWGGCTGGCAKIMPVAAEDVRTAPVRLIFEFGGDGGGGGGGGALGWGAPATRCGCLARHAACAGTQPIRGPVANPCCWLRCIQGPVAGAPRPGCGQ